MRDAFFGCQFVESARQLAPFGTNVFEGTSGRPFCLFYKLKLDFILGYCRLIKKKKNVSPGSQKKNNIKMIRKVKY